MKHFIMLIFLYLASSDSGVYYIVPNPTKYGNCTVNGTVQSPCYSLQQLFGDEIPAPSNESYITLILVSGTHVIPENQTLRATHLSRVVIRPWNEQQLVMVKCKMGTDLVFQSIIELKIASLHFNYCTLQCAYAITRHGNFEWSVYIANSIFENSRSDYAFSIESGAVSGLNITFSNCTFVSNNGAILASNPIVESELAIHLLLDSVTFSR